MLQVGDIGFTAAQGGGVVNKGILALTRNWPWVEPKTKAGHVFVVVSPHPVLSKTLIAEQTWPHLRVVELGTYLGKADVWIYRDLLMPLSCKQDLANIAFRKANKQPTKLRQWYGLGKILLMALDAIIGKTASLAPSLVGLLFGRRWYVEPYLFTQLDITGTFVCSQFVARLWWDQHYRFGDKSWLAATPDDLMDFCEANPRRFRLALEHYQTREDA